jgi:hypothetical protein
VLACTVRWHLEDRVLVDTNGTVVFESRDLQVAIEIVHGSEGITLPGQRYRWVKETTARAVAQCGPSAARYFVVPRG